MISGFAHEFLGFIKLTPDELAKANRIRAARGDPPMEHLHFCIKKFDYGANRQGYWITDDMIEHCVEVMDGLDAKFGVDQYQYMFLFDHSANHEAFAEDALRASVMSKGWGGKQPKLRPTVFYTHKAVEPEDIKHHPRRGVLSVGKRVQVQGWWSTRRRKWAEGVIVTYNDCDGSWDKGTYVIDFEEGIDQPMCFAPDSPTPISKYSGRGTQPDSHVGHAKGAYQVLWERGRAPRVIPRKPRLTSGNTYKRAILKYLEDEGRVEARHHDSYCSVCATYDPETDTTSCPPGDLIDCTYCNHARHVKVCARLPKHVVSTFETCGKIPGAWACPDCIEYARKELGLERPTRVTPAVNSSSDSSDADDDEAQASASVDDGILLSNVRAEQTEDDLTAVDGLVFGEWSLSHMRMLIESLEDFRNQKSRVHETIEARGHKCIFLPKFHCEYNWIEWYWCLSKWHTRGRADMTWKGLKHAIWEAFGVIPFDNPTNKALPTSSLVRQRESRRAREYVRAYSRGACVTDVDTIRNGIKSERVAFSTTFRTDRFIYQQHRTPSVRGVRVSPIVTETQKRVYRCSNCGLLGHNSKTCTNN